MLFKKLLIILNVCLLTSYSIAENRVSEVVSAEDIEWGYLNPLRGELSPGAADLWGDRTKDGATGMLVRFNKGFSSPPHIHNITYRGVVIEGLMHNDDPSAEKMWLPTGSFWTQPAGEEHITAADGETNLIYLEIDSGPYLVMPSKEKFDNGERPLNLHRSNMVWLDHKHNHNVSDAGGKITFLWGSEKPGELGGTLLKIPAGFNGVIESSSPEFRAVVIQGAMDYQSSEIKKEKVLTAGSYFSSTGEFVHEISIPKGKEAVVYIRSNNDFQLK